MWYYIIMSAAFLLLMISNIYLLIENKRAKEREGLWREISDMQTKNVIDLASFAVRISAEIGEYEHVSDNVVQFKRRDSY